MRRYQTHLEVAASVAPPFPNTPKAIWKHNAQEILFPAERWNSNPSLWASKFKAHASQTPGRPPLEIPFPEAHLLSAEMCKGPNSSVCTKNIRYVPGESPSLPHPCLYPD